MKTLPPIVTLEELHTLVERTLAAVDAYFDRGDGFVEYFGELDQSQRGLLHQALAFVGVMCGELSHPSLTKHLPAIAAAGIDFRDDDKEPSTTIAWGIQRMLLSGAIPIDEHIVDLSVSDCEQTRQFLAAALDARDAQSAGLLQELASDDDADVRRAAKEQLAKVKTLPWWLGKFPRDPLARLSEKEAKRAGPALRKVAKILDGTAHEITREIDTLAKLAQRLPDELVTELADKVYRGAPSWASSALATEAFSRPSGLALLVRWVDECEPAKRYETEDRFVKAIAALPETMRVAHAHALAERCLEAEPPAGEAPLDSGVTWAARIAASSWPRSVDPLPIVEVLLAHPELPESLQPTARALAQVVGQADIACVSFIDRAVEAFLSNASGGWQWMHRQLPTLLENLPAAALRAAAERAIGQAEASIVEWGLHQLFERVHDPERDGELPAFVRRMTNEARLAKIIFADAELIAFALPVARERLRQGELDLDEAVLAMRVIDETYGGCAEGSAMDDSSWRVRRRREKKVTEEDLAFAAAAREDAEETPPDEEAEEATAAEDAERAAEAAKQARLESCRGAEAWRGPPTLAEWTELRRLRDAADADVKAFWGALQVLPVGEDFEPPDRVFLERCLALWREDKLPDLPILDALAKFPRREYLPLLDEIERRTDSSMGQYIRQMREKTLVRAGMPLPSRTSQTRGPKEGTGDEWMDEDAD